MWHKCAEVVLNANILKTLPMCLQEDYWLLSNVKNRKQQGELRGRPRPPLTLWCTSVGKQRFDGCVWNCLNFDLWKSSTGSGKGDGTPAPESFSSVWDQSAPCVCVCVCVLYFVTDSVTVFLTAGSKMTQIPYLYLSGAQLPWKYK